MKRTFLIAGAIIAVTVTSCNKENWWGDFMEEVTSEEAQMRLDNSNYEMEEIAPLTRSVTSDFYTSGIVAYKLNGETVAVVDFGDGSEDAVALKTVNGIETEFNLSKTCAESEKKKYLKVIIEPIVKTEDCDYIVSGVIKYYECEGGDWVATVDYGNGECDEWASKVWDGGSKTFSLDWDKK